MFFESAREQAESEFKANNKDALVRSSHPGRVGGLEPLLMPC
jgi:hypothetical protein